MNTVFPCLRSSAIRPAWAVALALGSGLATAASFSGAVNGELSADRLAPTFLQLDFQPDGAVPGSNVFSGTVGRNGGVVDLDYLWVNVPAGYRMSALRVGSQTTVGGGGSFVGLAAGGTMPVASDASTALGLLGYKVYRLEDRTTDILDDMAVPSFGSSGFERPLAAGDYTFWIQELGSGSFDYRFNIVLSPVPGPAALAWLLGAGLLALRAGARRRQRPGEDAMRQPGVRAVIRAVAPRPVSVLIGPASGQVPLAGRPSEG